MHIVKDYTSELINNYESVGDTLVKKIFDIKYTKKKVNKLFVFVLAIIIRNIINTIVSLFIYSRYRVINFFLQIIISVAFILNTQSIYYHVKKYEPDVLYYTSYVIDNYTFNNYRLWKKYIVSVVSTGMIIYLLLTPIDSYMLIELILQFLICYLIIDNIENKNGIIYDIKNFAIKAVVSETKQVVHSVPVVDEDYIKRSQSAMSETFVELTHTHTHPLMETHEQHIESDFTNSSANALLLSEEPILTNSLVSEIHSDPSNINDFIEFNKLRFNRKI